jgi:hypothetical protein
MEPELHPEDTNRVWNPVVPEATEPYSVVFVNFQR